MVIREGVHREIQENKNPDGATALSQQGMTLSYEKGLLKAFEAITSLFGALEAAFITMVE